MLRQIVSVSVSAILFCGAATVVICAAASANQDPTVPADGKCGGGPCRTQGGSR